jgi:small subunit ribosomal protein S6
VKIDEWGKKRLAYEIKDVQDGVYYIVYFEATAQTLAEVTRVLGITDTVLRFMPLRHDKPFSVKAPGARAKAASAEEPEE